MKTFTKTTFVFTVLLLTVLATSCTSSGQYMPLSNDETVTGTVQTVFSVSSIFFFRHRTSSNAISREAYKHLLIAAHQKYPNSSIDVRDVLWVSRPHDPKTAAEIEIYTSGKVIRIGSGDPEIFRTVEETPEELITE